MEIKITTDHAASSYNQPVILIDGELVDTPAGVARVYQAIEHLPCEAFFGQRTTLAQLHDPLPYIARAERAEKQLDAFKTAQQLPEGEIGEESSC
jgi:hypothetical protein